MSEGEIERIRAYCEKWAGLLDDKVGPELRDTLTLLAALDEARAERDAARRMLADLDRRLAEQHVKRSAAETERDRAAEDMRRRAAEMCRQHAEHCRTLALWDEANGADDCAGRIAALPLVAERQSDE